MANFAEINSDNIVVAVYVVNDDILNVNRVEVSKKGEDFMKSVLGDNKKFVQTSYNTKGGVHYSPNGIPSGIPNKALRKNYAGIGYTYDQQLDAFIPPKPFPSWVLDSKSCLWEAPVKAPSNGDYRWDEQSQKWVKWL
jgi:hypothetical protein